MRRMGVLGLCLAATFAVSVIAAASAFAEAPEFMVCAKAAKAEKEIGGKKKSLYIGKYSEKTCAKEAPMSEQEEGKHNKYERAEWKGAKKFGYKGRNEGPPKSLAVDPLTGSPSAPGDIVTNTECQKEKVLGEVTGPKTVTWVTRYSKCTDNGQACHSSEPAAGKGEIVTQTLVGELVFLDNAKTEVGLKVHGEGPGGLLAQYVCGAELIDVHLYGAILAGPIAGDIETASKSWSMTAKAGPLGLQSNLYQEGVTTEGEGKRYFEWVAEYQACVKEGELPSECALEANLEHGGPAPPEPVALLARLEGPAIEAITEEKETTLPTTQIGTSLNKGEAFLITL